MHRKKQIRSQERHPLNTRCPELQIRSLTSVPDAELRPPLAVVGRSGPEPGSVADSKWRSSRRALVPHGYRRRADPEPRFTSLASLRSGGVEDGGVERGRTEEWSTRRAGAQAPRWRDPALPCECESPRQRDEEDTSTEAPERRWRGREWRPEMEEMDERRDGGRSHSGEERLSGCTTR